MERHKVLYLGLDPKNFKTEGIIYHCPIIKIEPREVEKISDGFTHYVFTSKTTVDLFFDKFEGRGVLIAVGKGTLKAIQEKGYDAICAKIETQEGLIKELEKLDLKEAKVCYPHSSIARPLLKEYFVKRGVFFEEIILYDTVENNVTIPDVEFDEIVFTSGSTVDAYVKRFGRLPDLKKVRCIGPITEKALGKYVVGI